MFGEADGGGLPGGGGGDGEGEVRAAEPGEAAGVPGAEQVVGEVGGGVGEGDEVEEGDRGGGAAGEGVDGADDVLAGAFEEAGDVDDVRAELGDGGFAEVFGGAAAPAVGAVLLGGGAGEGDSDKAAGGEEGGEAGVDGGGGVGEAVVEEDGDLVGAGAAGHGFGEGEGVAADAAGPAGALDGLEVDQEPHAGPLPRAAWRRRRARVTWSGGAGGDGGAGVGWGGVDWMGAGGGGGVRRRRRMRRRSGAVARQAVGGLDGGELAPGLGEGGAEVLEFGAEAGDLGGEPGGFGGDLVAVVHNGLEEVGGYRVFGRVGRGGRHGRAPRGEGDRYSGGVGIGTEWRLAGRSAMGHVRCAMCGSLR